MPGAKGVDVVGLGPREAGHVNVRDAGELAFGLADGPAHDLDAGEPLGGGEFKDLVEVEFRKDGSDESKFHNQLMMVLAAVCLLGSRTATQKS